MALNRPNWAGPGQARPAVSVIVPVYQSAWSIERTIASVLRQRFTDFEVIVVDDGSTDGIAPLLAEFQAADPRVRAVRQPNRGLAAARNRGIAEARAALVAPLDADDLWHPDFLAECVAALRRTPAAPFAFAYSIRIDEQDNVLPTAAPPAVPLAHDVRGLLSFNAIGNGSAAMFRKDALLAIGGYDETMGERGLHGAEDYGLALRLAHRAPPVLVERSLVAYRRVESGMSLGDPDRQLRACIAVIDEFAAEAPDLPPRLFRDARTTMTGWLLPAFLSRGEYAKVLRLAVRAYLANPLWILNPIVRGKHIERVQLTLANLRDMLQRRPSKPVPLADSWFAGERSAVFGHHHSALAAEPAPLASACHAGHR